MSSNENMEQAASLTPEIKTQFAALCWRMKDSTPQVLLITSRDTGRWVVPKGWPMKGRSPSEAAAREAWEEAGVTGRPFTHAIGCYRYDKIMSKDSSLPCEVTVFPLEVEKLEEKFPEVNQRRRKWFHPEKAARKVAEPGLRQLILAFAGIAEAKSAPVNKRGGKVKPLTARESLAPKQAANEGHRPEAVAHKKITRRD